MHCVCASHKHLNCRILSLDLTEDDSLPSKVEHATKAFGHIDILILAAGILQFGYFKDIPPEVDRKVMEVNYFGQRALIQAVLPGEQQWLTSAKF